MRLEIQMLALTVAASGCALGSGADRGPVTPETAGVRSYFAPMPAGAGEEAMTDPLQQRLFGSVVEAARGRGLPPPDPDARLEAVAAALARVVGPDDVPGVELQEFLLHHYGLGEPAPHLLMLDLAAGDDLIHGRIVPELRDAFAGGPFGRAAVGVSRRWPRTSVVVALQRIDVEMLPVPRRFEPDGSALLGGRLLRGLRDPRVLVARPDGNVGELPVRLSADSFQSTFRCDGSVGRHQIEVTGRDSGGKSVVANFPVFCGVDPPASAPRALARPETLDAREAETLALELVNRDRAEAGLPALAWDEPLARVARSYSAEMAASGAVRHVSATSGNAADRVRRARVEATVALENVARASSVADAQRSFMTSPGHRANVLDRRVTRLGVGVTIDAEPGRVPTLYVTQLFAR